MRDYKKASYYNTLIFTIISSIVAVSMMALLFFSPFVPYLPFIAASESGLIGVIVFSLFKIIGVENAMDTDKASNNLTIDFDTCPDYFVKIKDVVNTGNTYCSNEHVVRDAALNVNYIMKLYPVDPAGSAFVLPQQHDASATVRPSAAYDKFYLGALDADAAMKTTSQKCDPIMNATTGAYKYYDVLPWSYMTSRCDGLV